MRIDTGSKVRRSPDTKSDTCAILQGPQVFQNASQDGPPGINDVSPQYSLFAFHCNRAEVRFAARLRPFPRLEIAGMYVTDAPTELAPSAQTSKAAISIQRSGSSTREQPREKGIATIPEGGSLSGYMSSEDVANSTQCVLGMRHTAICSTRMRRLYVLYAGNGLFVRRTRKLIVYRHRTCAIVGPPPPFRYLCCFRFETW